jgi:HEPN domain-containing protein
MIILFGSYARWDFVESDKYEVEWHIEEYKSDFDILIINRKPVTRVNYNYAHIIEKNIAKANITTPTHIIIEHINHINKSLEENRYFYHDIKKEWIILYDNKKVSLSSSKSLTDKEIAQIKKDDFDFFTNSAKEFYDWYKFYLERENLRTAIFMLHQATERYITAYLLSTTWYKPKTHDLLELYEHIKALDSKFDDWFNLDDEREYHLFDLLRKAYTEARFSKLYQISIDEINTLDKKLIFLKNLI